MTRRGPVVVVAVALALTLALGAPVATVTASTPAGGSDVIESPPEGSAGVELSGTVTPPPSNNSTRHENPDATDENGDLGDVSGWLESQLGGMLTQNQLQISGGLYDTAEGLFGEDFGQRYSQYVDVAGETGTSSDDNATDEIQKAKEQQEELANETRTYRETREQYREARRNGNTERARELARKLQRLRGRILETTADLEQTYRTISAGTSADLERASEDLAAFEANVSEQVSNITDDLFVATQLSVEASPEGSFVDPITLQGRLQTANGTALDSRTVTIAVGNWTATVETDAEGGFEAAYRPTTIPIGERSLTVRFVPNDTGLYLGSNATVTTDILQTRAKTTIESVPDAAGFNDTVTVRGRVAAEGVGASGVPVRITLGETVIARTRTSGEGSFTATGRVPAAIDPGTRQVQVVVPLEGRALTVPPTNASVSVTTTPTKLSVTGRSRGIDTLALRGQLRTVDGTPIADQPIALEVGGTRVGTAVTNATGAFRTTVSVPSRLATANATVDVTARYQGANTNLEASTDAVSVLLEPVTGSGTDTDPGAGGNGAGGNGGPGAGDGPGAGGGSGTGGVARVGGVTVTVPMIAGGIGVIVVLAGGLYLLRRRGGDAEPVTEATPNPDAETQVDTTARDRLSLARSQLDAGDHDGAVRAAYQAARAALASGYDLEDQGTHWEFVQACTGADVEDSNLSAFETLTETYERAAFAPQSVSQSVAEDALEIADGLGH